MRPREGLGIVYVVLATLCFATLDTTTKHAVSAVPILMLLWFRYAFQTVSVMALRLPVQGRSLFVTGKLRFQLLRGTLLFIGTACAMLSLRHLPVGEFSALVMLSPLLSTALSAWWLKAPVTRLRWAVLVCGFAGVLLIVHPGSQFFGWPLIYPAILVLANSGFHVLTSHMSADENPYTTQFYTGLVGVLSMSTLVWTVWDSALVLSWWPWLLLIGVAGSIGHLMLIRAFIHAPAPVIMPYIYSQIAFGMLGGWLVFGHVPDALAWIGMGVIAASGVANALLSARAARAAP
ncbi:MAG: DMT family transporter [Rhodoferax sp.]|nr:DMT family transporter [Rhodoferax sp.]